MRRSPSLQRLLVLGLSGPLIALNIWILSQLFRYFEHLITVLVASAILAFLLNYPVLLLERLNLKRGKAIAVVLLMSVALLVIFGLTVVPVLIDQTAQLFNKIPAWLEASRQNLDLIDRWAQGRKLPLDLQGYFGRVNSDIERQLQLLAPQALGLALGTVSWLIDGVLIMVLASYMLLYGDRMWRGLIHLLPAQFGVPLGVCLRLNFQNFFISQFLLGFFMFGILTPIFLFLKVPFALLFALLIAIANLIPLVGATLGIGLVGVLVMFQNFWLSLWVMGISIFVQQVKDNFLAPRLMGNFTGLNPVWIFIAILIGAQIAGLLGVFVAVPVAGTIKGTIDIVRDLNSYKITIAENFSTETPLD